jgi:hypothetical protein
MVLCVADVKKTQNHEFTRQALPHYDIAHHILEGAGAVSLDVTIARCLGIPEHIPLKAE